MHVIQEITDREIFHSPRQLLSPSTWDTRESVRAVVTGGNGRIALLRLKAFATHKLPGGGIEAGESIDRALSRELMEEIGCAVQDVRELGVAVERRYGSGLIQISYGFIARQTGKTRQPSPSESERSQGSEVIWANGIAEAISLIDRDAPDNYAGKFVRLRDLSLLKAARTYLA